MPVQQRPAPARKTPQSAQPKSGHPITSSRARAREEALNDWNRLGSLICVMRGWYADAGAIAEHGPGFTHEVATLAEGNEKVAKYLDYLTETGPMMGILSAGLPLILQFAANHGRIDAEKLPPEAGIIKPEILEERVKAEMKLANARMLAEIKAIHAQAAELDAESRAM
jgi:hypothetical protein